MSKASQLRQKAQDFIKKGKLDKAIEEYKKLLSVESRNPNLYNELGDIYLRVGDRVQAVTAFEKATANYEKVALYNNAIAVCKKILRVVSNRLDTIFKLGELKAKQKMMGEAETYFAQYFDHVLADPQSGTANVKEKAETVLELLPDSVEIWSKVSDVFNLVGARTRAAEILAQLIARHSLNGDPKKINFFRSRLDLLKPSLEEKDIGKIDNILSSGQEAAGGPVKNAGRQGEVNRPEESNSPEAEEQMQAGAADSAAPEVDVSSGPADVENELDQGGSEASSKAGTGDTVSPMSPEVESSEDNLRDVEEESDEVRAEPAASQSEDLSEIIEKEDEENEKEDGFHLAEEITSDVEQDDFRSHYDLGMAYIEMALFDEAVKELQISARSQQLQLKALEMIGHCFLEMKNARLAVKQLERGLEIARNTGHDSLGLHYNLGLAFEILGDAERAREHFEEVYIVDVTFREVSDKMKKYTGVS